MHVEVSVQSGERKSPVGAQGLFQDSRESARVEVIWDKEE
jgi:hypothetical protein